MANVRKFSAGYDFADKKFAEQKALARKYVNKFFVERGKSTTVIFLTDKPVIVEEHNIPDGRTQSGKNKFRQITSPATFGERDPLKDSGVSRTSMVAYYTVLDGGEYTDKNNKKHQWEKKLCAVKTQVFDIVKRRRADILEQTGKERNLAGAMFKVFRGNGDKTPSSGDDWQYVKHVSKRKMLELMAIHFHGEGQPTLDPINYDEVLAPPPMEELKAIAARLGAPVAETGDDDDDDDRPVKAKKAKRPVDDEDDDDDGLEDEEDDEEDEPVTKKKKGKLLAKKKVPVDDDDEEDDEELFEEEEDEAPPKRLKKKKRVETEDFED